VAHCSECGEAVWVGLSDPDIDHQIRAKGVNGFRLIDDATRIYRGWGFEGSQSPNIVVLSPWRVDDEEPTEPNQRPYPPLIGSSHRTVWWCVKEAATAR
jgi:hypothetical protein